MRWSAAIAVLVSATAGAQVTQTFRDGVSPPGYTGTRDVMIMDVTSPPDANYDGLVIKVDGSPFTTVALVRFDVGAIAPGTPLLSAELTINIEDGSPEVF